MFTASYSTMQTNYINVQQLYCFSYFEQFNMDSISCFEQHTNKMCHNHNKYVEYGHKILASQQV